MSDSVSSTVDGWLEPLSDSPCGNDPEYDNDFAVELPKAVNGKPGDQFKPEGEPPNWRQARDLAEQMFERCRDIRVAAAWTRALVHLEGGATLAGSLRLVHGLLERHWDTVHPVPDDGDAYARVNALNDLCSAGGLIGDLRQSLIVRSRAIGEVRGRDIEIALGTLDARPEDRGYSKGQLQQMFVAAIDADPGLAAFPATARDYAEKITALMREKVGYAAAPNLQPLVDIFNGIASLLPSAAGDSGDLLQDLSIGVEGGAPPRPRSGGGFSGGIDSREDALRAIDLVCDYLERTEPTNPAQMLLRRARKLVDKNFLELVREFAPASAEEVARILGVTDDGASGSY